VGEEEPRPDWGARWHELRTALRSDRRVAAGLLACVALAAGVAWVRAGAASAKPPPTQVSSSLRSAPSSLAVASTTVGSTRPTGPLVVDVVGAVRRAGVVRVPAGARVVDVIAAAGGATADADLVRLNLAAPVADGARVAVPRVGAPAPAVDPSAVTGGPAGDGSAAPDPTSAGPVNLNSATAAQLDALPGIGPATAAAIVHDRETHGPFTSVDDLTRVRGIGPAKLAQLHDLVTV